MNSVGKILHLPIETAGQMATISRAQRKLGYEAHSVVYEKNPYAYPVDRTIEMRWFRKKGLHLPRQMIFAFESLFKYDVFHFHYGRTFIDGNWDISWLRRLKKKMLMHCWGSEIRTLDMASRKNRYVRIKEGQDTGSLRKKMAEVARHIDVAVVADHELAEYVDGFFRRVEIVPQAIDLDCYEPCYPSEHRECLKIVHAPSNSWVKGTEFIKPAIERMKKRFRLDYVLVRNMTHEEALKIYREADIVIDQLLLGSYGIFAIEAMALGKPVLCYIRDDIRKKYPPGLPIVSTNPDNLEENLEMLCADPGRRVDIGEKGRAYVKHVHDGAKVAKALIELYKTL